MITEKLQNAINEQITAEMWSSNLIWQCLSTWRKRVIVVWLPG